MGVKSAQIMVAARGVVGDVCGTEGLRDLVELGPLPGVMAVGNQVAALQDEFGVQPDDLLDDARVGGGVRARVAVGDEGESLVGGHSEPGREMLGGGLRDGGQQEQQ